MLSWIWIPVLYVLAFGLFGWLGGIAAAGDAIARWGRETAERRRLRRFALLLARHLTSLEARSRIVGDALLD